MDITQTTDEGLKRAFRVVIPAKDIDARVSAEVSKIAPQVKMPGFRPGKVPANLVRKMHGEQLHAQALNDTIRESVDTLMREKQLRPAMQPTVALGEGYADGKDAEVTVELEVLPKVDLPQVEGLKLERLTVPVADADVDAALTRLAGQNKSYSDAGDDHAAAAGDQLLIDFVGRADGTEFDGGKAEDATLVLGSNTFIPGFEDQLTGAKAGERRIITVTFPADYPADNLKGREAEFDVTVKSVKAAGETQLDDEFAKMFGLEGIDKLREIMRAQLEQETAGLTRTQMKRALLDQLAAGHDFAVPQTMVEAEFSQIWQQLEAEVAKAEDPVAAKAEIEAERDDYRRIAERRVRLGLLLSEIGQANNIQISNQEMSMLVQQAAQQYRAEDRQRFIEYVQSEPMAAAQLRAPLYEDKVVDFLFDKAEVTDREVTREQLEAAIEAEEGAVTSTDAQEQAAPVKAGRKGGGKKVAKAGSDPEVGDGGSSEPAAGAEPQTPGQAVPKKKGGGKGAAAQDARTADEVGSPGGTESGAPTGIEPEVVPAKKPARKAKKSASNDPDSGAPTT